MMRKLLATVLALLVTVSVAACTHKQEQERLTVVCTVFPVYDWVREIVGDSDAIEPILLVQNGTDLHSYQPTAADMVTVASCDLIIRVGGESEAWVEEAMAQKAKEGRRELVLSSLSEVTLRQIAAESVLEGEEDHDHDHEHDHRHGTNDEHLWLSLRNAGACVAAIAEAICELDPAEADGYRENAVTYRAALTELDEDYQAEVATVEQPRLVIADRFPFVYLTEDYGIEYVAAFEGCTTDTDADFSTVVRLAQALDSWELGAVLVTESSDGALASSVIAASKGGDREIVSMNSMQAVTADALAAGVTYLGVMEENLDALLRTLTP